MHTGDEGLAWNDAGPCPACGDSDCWLGCDEERDAVDDDEPIEVVSAEDVQLGDVIDGYTVHDIAPSALAPDQIVIAAARNGHSVANAVERTEQIEVVR